MKKYLSKFGCGDIVNIKKGGYWKFFGSDAYEKLINELIDTDTKWGLEWQNFLFDVENSTATLGDIK